MPLFLRILALLCLPTASLADSWVVDSSQSSVSFSVTHMLVDTVTGSFGNFSGSAETDASGQLTAILGTVQTVSVNTQNDKRDKHLRNADFFDVPSFASASFQSTSVTADGDGYSVTGNLTIRGTTREVVLSLAALSGPSTGADGLTQLETVATTTINRQNFGVSWSKILDNGGVAVSDEVQLTLQIRLTQKAAE